MVEVFDRIYLGSLNCAFHAQTLVAKDIKFILDLSQEQFSKQEDRFRYFDIQFGPQEIEEVKKYFNLTNRLLSQSLEAGGAVLILYSRAQTVALAFALARELVTGTTPLKALLVKAQNKGLSVDIHQSLMKQLDLIDMGRQVNINDKI